MSLLALFTGPSRGAEPVIVIVAHSETYAASECLRRGYPYFQMSGQQHALCSSFSSTTMRDAMTFLKEVKP